jgi:hypothetical protein
MVAEDDAGTYLEADDFEQCADADAVQAAVGPLVVLLNGVASLSFSGPPASGLQRDYCGRRGPAHIRG